MCSHIPEALASNTAPRYLSHDSKRQLGLIASSATHVDLSRAGDFISQVAEDGPGAKRSCALTAQLNAYIAKSELDQPTAMNAQYELCFNPAYDFMWSDPLYGPDRKWRAWHAAPRTLVKILNAEYGLSLSIPEALRAPRHELRSRVESHLQQGGVAWLCGDSKVARHARTAFEPAHSPRDQLFVHDPHYPETTGLYSYDAIRHFQLWPHAILY